MKNRSYSKKIPEQKESSKREDLRAENRKLRKEVQLLRREIFKMIHRDEDVKEIIEEHLLQEEENRVEEIKYTCKKCRSSNVIIMKDIRPGIDYYSCQECSSKGPIK